MHDQPLLAPTAEIYLVDADQTPMTTIRTDQIQCRADEATATEYRYEHDGRPVMVLAWDNASADDAFADWRAGRCRSEALADTEELFRL